MLKSIETQSLRLILPIVFALIFTIPFLIFFCCVLHFGILHHQIIQISFAVYLTFSLLGYIILRQIVDRIIKISAYAASIHYDTLDVKEQNELKKIAATFNSIE